MKSFKQNILMHFFSFLTLCHFVRIVSTNNTEEQFIGPSMKTFPPSGHIKAPPPSCDLNICNWPQLFVTGEAVFVIHNIES